MNDRAVHTSPSIRTQPTPSSFAMRSSTIASLPTSAAVPVRSFGGMRRCERASGRSAVSRTMETTRKTASEPTNGTPAALTTAATAAPPANDRQRRRVRRVHAVVAEPAGAERAGLRVRRVGGVMDDPEVDRELGEVDRLADRVAIDVRDLVDGRAVGAGLHLHDRERLAVV